jgi:subtilisin family serine protease
VKGILAALLLAAFVAGCAPAPTRGPNPLSLAGVSSDRQILLTIRQNRLTAVQLRGAPNMRYTTRRGYGPSPDVELALNQIEKKHRLKRVDGWHIASLDVYCEVFAVEPDVDIGALLDELRDDPRVELAQRMNVFETLLSNYDDPYADLQQSVLDLEIEPAHRLATGRGVTVAIIDSGIDNRHPDLKGRVTVSRDLSNRYPGARGGEIHGTAIAGVIASRANNTVGIVGVAPDATIAALRACWAIDANTSAARCSSYSLALAIETAMMLKTQIINLSLAGPFDPLLAQLLDEAMARGIVVVAAAAEEQAPEANFPASHPGVIAARSANVDTNGSAAFSVPAPGREILTTTPNAGYAFLSGNSLAAAHVSGVIALLLEKAPSIDAGRLGLLLTESSMQTHGRYAKSISACRALVSLTGTGLCSNEVELVSF